jgi:hypothetical protein
MVVRDKWALIMMRNNSIIAFAVDGNNKVL